MISVTYKTDGAWGAGVGTLLGPEEIDGNFYAITQAVENLIANPPTPDEIASVTADGTAMTIHLQSGAAVGPIPLPALSWVWRGDWLPSTDYFQLNWFNVPDVGFFLTVADHTSGLTFDPEQVDVDDDPVLIKISQAAAGGLAKLADVMLTGLVDGQFLRWNATDEAWENVTLASVLGGSIATLTDVLLASLTDGQILRWVASASRWENANLDTLPTVPAANLLANLTAGVALPIAHSLSDILDAILSNAPGAIIVRGASTWAALAPGVAGYFLQTHGAGAVPSWASPAGSGTVTSVSTGTGLAGGPITGAGTVSLATVADLRLLANISGLTAAPTPQTMTAILDAVFASVRGSVLVRGASAWGALGPGTAGYYLKTQGTGADAVWDSPAGSGTVTSVSAGTGLTGGPITGAGTISLATQADGTFLANTSGGVTQPVATSLSTFLDAVIAGVARGYVLTRGASGWIGLAPGTAGQVLTTGGTATDVSWTSVGGGGANPTYDSVTLSPTHAFASVGEVSDGAGGFFMLGIFDSFGTGAVDYSNLNLRRARGTKATPAAVQSGDFLGQLTFAGHDGTGYSTHVVIEAQATENWDATHHGAKLIVATTPTGSSSTGTALDVLTAALTSIADKDVLVYDSASGQWKNQRAKYNIGIFVPGVMTASQKLVYHRFSKAVTIPANFGAYLGHASEAGGSANATASTVINIDKAASASPNTFSNVGTITIGAGGVTPTFATSGGTAVTFAQGDVLRAVGPASADATFADFYATLVGFET